MLPTLTPGQKVLVQKKWFFVKIKTKDLVALQDPRNGKLLVKRVKKIEGKSYKVLGDNQSNSTDSKDFGPIPFSLIIGKVIFVK